MTRSSNLSEILNKETIDLAISLELKHDVLLWLSNLLLNAGYIGNIEIFMDDIEKREILGVTGIGNYIAIPHGKSKTVIKSGIAIGKLLKPVRWESLDGKGVLFIVLFAVKDDNDYEENHLRLLAQFASKMGDDTIVSRLLSVDNYEGLVEIFR